MKVPVGHLSFEFLGLLGAGTSIMLLLSLMNIFGRSQLLFNVSELKETGSSGTTCVVFLSLSLSRSTSTLACSSLVAISCTILNWSWNGLFKATRTTSSKRTESDFCSTVIYLMIFQARNIFFSSTWLICLFVSSLFYLKMYVTSLSLPLIYQWWFICCFLDSTEKQEKQ